MKNKMIKRLGMFILTVLFLLPNGARDRAQAVNLETNKITPILREVIEQSDPEEKIPVLGVFEDADLSGAKEFAVNSLSRFKNVEEFENCDDVTDEEVQTYIDVKREYSAEVYNQHNSAIIEELSIEAEDVVFVSQLSPLIGLNLTAEQINELIDYSDLLYLDYDYTENDNEVSNALQTTRIPLAKTSYSLNGNGINIGVLDAYRPASNSIIDTTHFNELVINTSTSDIHGVEVTEIIQTVAPNAMVYYASVGISGNQSIIFDAIEELIIIGHVNIINASMRLGNDGDNSYGTVARWIDHIAINHDVHFVKSAGNKGASGITSGGMSYNMITVGAINNKGTAVHSDDDYYYYKLPDGTYSSTKKSSFYNSNELAYKPDISAPGVDLLFSCNQTPQSGTSFAAPQVAGTIALLCQQRSALKIRQDAVKAILTASVNFTALNKFINVPGDKYYKYVGAGTLDTYGACWVTANWRYQASSMTTASYKTYTFNVSSSDTRIRVALDLLKYITYSGPSISVDPDGHNDPSNYTETALNNLDLKIYAPNGTLVGQSTTTNNNVEIVDFVPSQTGTYTIRIERIGTAYGTIYYGVAWR